MRKGTNTPENIEELLPNQVFVFGSNLAGFHGSGAAFTAKTLFGAEMYVGLGITGQCYALPTKNKYVMTLPLSDIDIQIRLFYQHALMNPDKEYLVTKVGCGLAGYTVEQIGELFRQVEREYAELLWSTHNIILPIEFE